MNATLRALAFTLALVFTLALPFTLAACEPARTDAPDDLPVFRLDVDVEGQGAVVSAPTAIECGALCDAAFAQGTHVTLQARAAPGHAFVAWEGNCAGIAGPIVDLVMDADVECLARFVPQEEVVPEVTFALTVVVLGPGTVEAIGGLAEPLLCGNETCTRHLAEGAVVTLEARAAPTAELVGFSGDCTELFTGTAEVTMDADHTCTVSFFSEDDVTYPLRVHVTGTGRVTSAPGGIDCDATGAGCEARYPWGTAVTLQAHEEGSASFTGWTHACADAVGPIVSRQIQFGTACGAVFETTMDLAVIGGGTVSGPNVSCSGNCAVPVDGALALTAVADAGHRFVAWSDDCASDAPTVTVDASTAACTATFERIPPTVTVVVEGAGAVSGMDGAIACPAGACVAEVVHEPAVIDPGVWTCSLFFFGTGTGCNCGCGKPDPDCASSGADACQFFGDCEEPFIVEEQNHLCWVEEGGGVPTVTLTATPDDGAVFIAWQGPCATTAAGASAASVTVPVPDSIACTAVFAPAP